MKLEELMEEEVLEESVVLTGITGILLGILITDAIGLNTATDHPEKNFFAALKAGRFGGAKTAIAAIKKKLSDRKLKKQVEKLANDPEVREMIDNNMSGRAFKSGKKNESMALLNKKMKGSSYDEIRDILDFVRTEDFEKRTNK